MYEKGFTCNAEYFDLEGEDQEEDRKNCINRTFRICFIIIIIVVVVIVVFR